MESYFNNKNFFKLIIKWKYHLGIISVIVIILSIFFTSSIFINPKYESYAIIYPVNLASFSEESETEQMLQLLQSQDIKNKLFSVFHLAKHYDIDTTSDYWFTQLNKKYESLINYNKTEYESVKINVIDEDPNIASSMIDSIIVFYNDKVKSLHKLKSLEIVKGKEVLMRKLKHEIDSLLKIQNEIRHEYGILDYTVQTERLTEGYIKLLQGGNSKAAKETLIRL